VREIQVKVQVDCARFVRRRLGDLVTPRFLVPLACGAALFAAALPPAMYLVSVARWWQWENPALVLATVLVGLSLMLTGAIVGVLSGGPPLRRAMRQLAVGAVAAVVTYGLGLLFGATLG